MMEEYQEKVFATYQKKSEKLGRAFALYNPTGTRIRKECLKVYDHRHTSEDEDILATYFDKDKLGTDFRQVLSKSVADDYRALSNHLKGITGSTDEKNSDLLAWLIDFQPRPSFIYYKTRQENEAAESVQEEEGNTAQRNNSNQDDTPSTENNITIISSNAANENKGIDLQGESPKDENEIDQTDQEEKPPIVKVDEEVKNPSSTKRSIFIVAFILLIVSSCSFLLWNYKQDDDGKKIDFTQQGCMHWTGERYQLIDCNSEDRSTPIVVADTFKLAHMRKITRPDTLTKNALGKVWYVKIKIDSAEFYTDNGDYPLDTSKRLLPLTAYMLNKYVFAKYGKN